VLLQILQAGILPFSDNLVNIKPPVCAMPARLRGAARSSVFAFADPGSGSVLEHGGARHLQPEAECLFTKIV
jgi:hypothetical protein